MRSKSRERDAVKQNSRSPRQLRGALSYTPSEKVLKTTPKSEAMLHGKFKAMNFLQRSEFFAESKAAKLKQKHAEEMA